MSLQHLLFIDNVTHVHNISWSYPSPTPTSLGPRQIAVWCPKKQKQGVQSPGAGGLCGYKPPCGCSKVNPGLVQEQRVQLSDEQSLQPPNCISWWDHESASLPLPSVSPVYPGMNWTFLKICISHQKTTCLLHWLILTVHSTQPRVAWEGEPQLRNCPDQTVPLACLCEILWAVSWCRKARPLWAAPFPRQVIPGYVRKLAKAWTCEQASQQAASSMVPAVSSGCEVSLLIGVNDVWTGKQACLELHLCLPPVTDCDLGL